MDDRNAQNASKNEDESKGDHATPQPGVDPKLIDPDKTPGSGMFPDDGGSAPSG
jgi:hypothetical protein